MDNLRSPENRVAVPVTRRALVVGGGITGIQASLDIADAGYEVLLVEKTPSIGGHMLQYSEVFPTLDCPQCIGTPKMVEVGQHSNIRILAYSEVESVSDTIGAFTVRIRRKATYVDWDRCNGCGLCLQKCPVKVPSEYNCFLPFGNRGAIYVPFAQAVPNKPVVDAQTCRYLKYRRFMEEAEGGKEPPECRICEKLCPLGVIDWEQQDEIVEENVGAIVVAAGFDLMAKGAIGEFAQDPDIIDGLEFERILCPSGPTAGAVMRPSDGIEPREVVFISCVGSRDPELGVPYCSRVCCMYLAKQALLYKHAVPDGQAYIFYMDQRTTGKGYEEFVRRAVEEYDVMYLRGRVSKIFRDGDRLRVQGADTLSGKRVDISCDLVVLGMAMMPSAGFKELARKLGIATDEYGFVTELHSKFRPMETSVPGIYVAGTAQGPRDIPDSVAMGSGVASKVLRVLSLEEGASKL
ncbi:CoB--CoM heterodisulfide reductase iron-sulfur subunit A family protein [Dehalococcoidia bacterium]|nr:CoB--CoM heterodisulfide reductase iron-sulfur subunit A family protein [Dehalococcoidia bacterium]MCL0076921.1 CoB--CoM heterodisulfide reductase iron-sulfur subunit A family protein [Dehalococcoidia bacterium]